MSFFRFVFPSTCAFLAVSFTALQSRRAESRNLAEKIPRIAVIGSGIGGSATAHFIRDIFGENAQISVFEKADRVGGRLATLDFADDKFEAGGSIIHPRNLYMRQFVEELGLEINVFRDGIFSLYNGENIVFSTSSWSWLTALKLLWRYGFSLIKMEQATKDLLKKFESIYALQKNSEAFSTVPDMLKAMDKEFHKLTQISVREYLLKKGLSEQLVDELVTAITRINYGQSTEVNALTGMVSLAGAEPDLWAVQGGNWKVCEGLLKKSSAILNKNTQIIEIIKKPNDTNEGRPLYFLRSAETLINTPFDAVVIAMPLEVGDNFIGCSGCEKWPSRNELGRFHQTVATFVNGTPNEDIFTSNMKVTGTVEKDDIFFNSIGKVTSVNKGKQSENKSANSVWKVFSRKPLSHEQKKKLFSQVADTKEVNWLAYPHYTPPEKFLPFVFDEGVFYVNAIEWAASAMEMSSLSAKNAALLTSKYLKKTKATSQGSESVHEEL